MSDFYAYLNDQLKNEEFRKEYLKIHFLDDLAS